MSVKKTRMVACDRCNKWLGDASEKLDVSGMKVPRIKYILEGNTYDTGRAVDLCSRCATEIGLVHMMERLEELTGVDEEHG